jgi:hypothetical protein
MVLLQIARLLALCLILPLLHGYSVDLEVDGALPKVSPAM